MQWTQCLELCYPNLTMQLNKLLMSRVPTKPVVKLMSHMIFASCSSLPDSFSVFFQDGLVIFLFLSCFLIQPTPLTAPHPSLLGEAKNADSTVIVQLELLMGAILVVITSLPTIETVSECSLSTDRAAIYIRLIMWTLDCHWILCYTWIHVQQWRYFLPLGCLSTIWEVEVERLVSSFDRGTQHGSETTYLR